MAAFKIGDSVQNRSGGPVMTIAAIGTNNSKRPDIDFWLCEWTDEKKKKQKRCFHKDILKHFGGNTPPLFLEEK